MSAPPVAPAPVTPPTEETVASIHWLGKKQLSAETNASVLMAIWRLPESVKLESQTLDKFSRAPWRLLDRDLDTNAAAMLRPLLNDLLQSESYVEIRQAGNLPGELDVAVRLDNEHAGIWETNLASAVESLAGAGPAVVPGTPHGWSLTSTNPGAATVAHARNGDWTLVGFARGRNPALDAFAKRIEANTAAPPATNYWLTASIDPARTLSALSSGSTPPAGWPHVAMDVIGDGTNSFIHANLTFPTALQMDLEPWKTPIPLIDWTIMSFTSVRGLKPWLENWPVWTNLDLGPAPNQASFWGLRGLPMMTYFTVPMPDASNVMVRLTDEVLEKGAPWFATNSLARFARSDAFHGLQWRGSGYMEPFVRSLSFNGSQYVFGGFFSNSPSWIVSTQLFDVLRTTNLVYYDWETSGLRTEQWLYLGQLIRFVSLKPQLPFNSASMRWLRALGDKLGESVTRITQTGPAELEFTRRSSIGFTGFELQLLADWLESPDFPVGLHTFRAAPTPQAPPPK